MILIEAPAAFCQIAIESLAFDAAGALASLLLVALLANSAQASNVGHGATASGYDYLPIEEPNGTVVAQAALLYSTGAQGLHSAHRLTHFRVITARRGVSEAIWVS